MAHVFEEVTGSAGALSFQFNGQFALKNYNVEIVNGNRLKVVSTANEMFSLLEADISEVEINGVTYTDPSAAQIALTSLVHSDAEPVVLTKEQYMALAAAAQGQDRGTIAPDTATPTGGWQVGWYKPTTSSASPGTNYPNQGNQKAISGFSNKLYYDGTTWLMVREKFDRSFLPQFADLQFPVTNPSGGDKVQCVYSNMIVQLKNGKTATIANVPTGKDDDEFWMYLSFDPVLQSGKSAYEVAVANGFVGTEAQWLASLKPAVLQNIGTSTTDAMSQKAVTDEVNKIYNGVTTLTPDTSIPFNLTSYYYYYNNDNISPNAYGCTRTEKFLLKKDEKLKYGINIYNIIGSIGHINFYNLDGSFKSNYLKTTDANKATFVQGEYIATEDVMVGISNYEQGNYGAEYVTIVHTASSNLNKGLTFLLENAEDVEDRLTELEAQDVNSVGKEVENLEMYERGQASLNLSPTKKIGILVAGQSNTEGRVPIAQAPSYITSNDNTVPNVQMWNNGTKLFAPFKFGVNTGSGTGATTATLYAYDAIASYLLAQNKSQPIYLIKRAQGGTAIDVGGTNGGGYWTPKTELITSGHKLIEQLKERARTALASDPTLEIKAVMWHQGEGDSTTTAAPLYYQNLKNVIAYIRGIVGNPKLPFVFGTIATISAQYNATVDAAIRKIDTEDPFVFLVDMSAGTLLDAYHFDATSTNNLGTAMFNILKNVV